jgi:hypothetical protein
MEKCAIKYAKTVKTIFPVAPVDLEMFVKEKLVKAPKEVPTPATQMVFNAGPRKSDTRSMFIALTGLNVTARHFNYISSHCRLRIIRKGMTASYMPEHALWNDAGAIFKRNYPTVWWGDVPAPEVWWKFLYQYPNSRVTMTDMNATEWYVQRKQSICGQSDKGDDFENMLALQGCTPPVPFELTSKDKDSRKVLSLLRLSNVSPQDNKKLWEAYRSLLKCAESSSDNKFSRDCSPHMLPATTRSGSAGRSMW